MRKPSPQVTYTAVVLCLLSLISASGFAQDDQSADPKAIADFARAVLRTNTIADLQPATIVDRLERDPFRIFDFVRDEIAFQAYRGVLRGAEGTLAARAGNVWDQAVLLKTMFDKAEVNSSILRVGLEEDQARVLVDSIRPVTAQYGEPFDSADLSTLSIDTGRYQAPAVQRNAAVQTLLDRVALRSAADVAALEKAGSFIAPVPDLVSATRDYIWVQAEINGRPYDFHPAFPSGKQPVLLPAGVMKYVTSIPSNQFHWVRLRVFLERLTDTGLDRTAILDKRVLTAIAAGASTRIAMRPEMVDERFLRLNPALTVGDTLLSGKGATVAVADGKPLPGSATALWLEVTLMSPGEPPRVITLTLVDAFGTDRERLGDETAQIEVVTLSSLAFSSSAELHFVAGGIPSSRWAQTLAISMRRLADVASKRTTVKANGLFGLLPDNPLLTSWGALLSGATNGAYQDSPTIAAIIYEPDDRGLSTRGKVLFSRFIDAKSKMRSLAASIAAPRLLEALSEERGSAVLAAEGYSLHSDGEFTEWDSASRLELLDEVAKDYKIWLPAEDREHWWSGEQSGGMMLNGSGGWAVVLPAVRGAGTPERLLSGELVRLVSGFRSDSLSAADAQRALAAMVTNYVSDALSPLASALSSFGTAKEARP